MIEEMTTITCQRKSLLQHVTFSLNSFRMFFTCSSVATFTIFRKYLVHIIVTRSSKNKSKDQKSYSKNRHEQNIIALWQKI